MAELANKLVFIPALVTLLLNAEKHAGRPLVEAEVYRLRDEAIVMAVPHSVAVELATQRGFPDVDPETVWPEWQLLRQQFSKA